MCNLPNSLGMPFSPSEKIRAKRDGYLSLSRLTGFTIHLFQFADFSYLEFWCGCPTSQRNSARNPDQIVCCGYMNLDQIYCCGYIFSQHPSIFRREQCSEPRSDCLLWLHEPRSDLLLWLHFRPISQHVQEGTVLGTWIRLLVVATWT